MHNYNIVYIMMFFLVSVALVSTFFGVLNLYPLQAEFLNHSQFFAASRGKFSLLITNDENFNLYDLHFFFEDSKVSLESLEALSSKVIEFETSFEHRGVYQLDSCHVESLFPLIHEKKSRNFSIDKHIVVYPKPDGISLMKVVSHQRHQSGDISDFKGITRFEDGENLSAIHWPSLAKNDTLMSKRFIFSQTIKKLKFNFSQMNGNTEEKLSQLTKWVLEASEFHLDFTLEIAGETLDSTKDDVDAILTKLALY